MPERFNIQLDDFPASKLRELADRTHVHPGTIARSLLTQALEAADPNPASVVDLLDSIPGALEKARKGVRQVRAGRGIPLDEL